MIYYNTTNLTGPALKEAVQRAKSQDEAIRLVFVNTRIAYSPSRIMEIMQKAGYNWPITSVRRSITNLTKAGHLVQTGEQVKGMYGSLENKWALNLMKYPTETGRQESLF